MPKGLAALIVSGKGTPEAGENAPGTGESGELTEGAETDPGVEGSPAEEYVDLANEIMDAVKSGDSSSLALALQALCGMKGSTG